ncbi:MAG: arginine--tRNA ligase [Alphaproteobacteria bacterium]
MNPYSQQAKVLRKILDSLIAEDAIQGQPPNTREILIETPRNHKFGDFSSNLALLNAKKLNSNPKKLAELISQKLKQEKNVLDASIAGPGFINWKLTPIAWQNILREILTHKITPPNLGGGQNVNVEFVSANPTGPLTIGHVRGAVIGDVIANLFAYFGWNVVREYYINDAGGQIEILAKTVELRMLEAQGKNIDTIPPGLYPGEYLKDIGQQLATNQNIPAHGQERYTKIAHFAVNQIMDGIRNDLNAIGIQHDTFSSDAKLRKANNVEKAIQQLKANGHVYRGTLPKPKGEDSNDWEPREQLLFRATNFGDNVDRPLQRNNGQWTYFASDLAYHYDKYQRTQGRLIDIWGADHSGYNQRISSALNALTNNQANLDIVVCQIVRLFRNGEEVRMSKRAGEFVTLQQVISEVGADALRYTLLTRKPNAPLDFDLNAAVEKSLDNPLFYVQYAHARTNSVIQLATQQFPQLHKDNSPANANLSQLTDPAELKTIAILAAAPRAFQTALETLEPHRITAWLRDLASQFHTLWSQGRDNTQLRFIINDDPIQTAARLALVHAVQDGLGTGLKLIGVQPLNEL